MTYARSRLIACLLILGMLAVPLVALASVPTALPDTSAAISDGSTAAPLAANEATNVIHELARVLLSALAAALTLLVTYYVPRLARALERRLHIDIPDPIELEAERVAIDAISYAEEWGRGQAKKLGKKVLSSDKLDQAAAYFRDHASAAVIRWTDDRVRAYLESKLGRLRMTEPVQLIPDPVLDAVPAGPSTPGAR